MNEGPTQPFIAVWLSGNERVQIVFKGESFDLGIACAAEENVVVCNEDLRNDSRVESQSNVIVLASLDVCVLQAEV